jgi:hypothetical protein
VPALYTHWKSRVFTIASDTAFVCDCEERIKKNPKFWVPSANIEDSQRVKVKLYGKSNALLTANEHGLTTGYLQQLELPMVKSTEYRVSMDLSYNNEYRFFCLDKLGSSLIRDFENPLRLRIWGGTNKRPKTELLAESAVVAHKDWKTYTFTLIPEKESYDTITFEGVFVSDFGEPYNGNLQIDNCSKIIKIKQQ